MTTKIVLENIADTSLATLTGPKVSSIVYVGDDTAAAVEGGQSITLLGSGFSAGASVLVSGTAATVVTVVSSTQLTFTSPPQTAGTYVIYVINSDGGTAISIPGISYSGTPNWSTSAGSLATVYETASISNTVTATGDAPITYSLSSGTLPTGSTLNSSTGLLSGTAPASAGSTTYTFTIQASDLQNQTTNRTFSVTVDTDVVTWSSPDDNTTYTLNQDSAMANVVLSAASAAGRSITYTANSLPTGISISGSNIAGTPTVTANTTSIITATASVTNRTATRTFNWIVSVANDLYFKNTVLLLNGETANLNWMADASTNSFAITPVGDSKPSAFSPYNTNWSNYFDGTGDYLTVPTNAAFQFGTGDFTIEAWIYNTSAGATDKRILCNWGGGANAYQFYLRTNNRLIWQVYTSNSPDQAALDIPLNVWTHVAWSKSGSNAYLFINGVLKDTTVLTQSANGTGTNVAIGSDNAGGSYFFGNISNLRVVKGTAVYTADFTPPTAPLTAISGTQLLTCQSNRFIDNSTNAFAITANGNTATKAFGPLTETDLTTGSGYFNTASLSSPSSSNLVLGSGNFTVECWVYNTGSLDGRGIFQTSTTTGINSSYQLAMAFNNATFFVQAGAGNQSTTGVTVVANRWYHLALVKSGSTLTLYVDGVNCLSRADTFTYTDTYITIGGYFSLTAVYALNGYISNFSVTKGTAVYTANFTPPIAPLTAVANTQLLTLQNRIAHNNNTAIDTSGNSLLVTRNGNTTQGSFSPYTPAGWSNYFDGTGDYLALPSSANLAPGSVFTFEAWIYIPAIVNSFNIYTASNNNEFQVGFNGSSEWGIATRGTAWALTTTTLPVLNQWNHIVACRGGTGTNQTSLFLNGVRVANGTVSAAFSGTSAYQIAANGAGAGVWNGYISNLRLVPGVDVYGYTNTTITVPTAPLTAVASTALLTCQNNRFMDNSTNNFTLTASGDTKAQAFSPFAPTVEYSAATHGGSMYFDGSGDYLVTSGAALDTGAGTSDFTMECWVYNNGYSGSQYGRGIFTFYPAAGYANSRIMFRLNNGGDQINIYLYISGTLHANTTSTVLATPGAWTHVAYIRQSGTFKLYINGTIESSMTVTGVSASLNTFDKFDIGRNQDGSLPDFNGYISNFRYVKGTAVYTGNFTPPTAPLTAISGTQLLLKGTNAGIIDSTGRNDLETGGDAKISTAVKKYGTGSIYFDGTGDYVQMASSPNFALAGDFTIEFWMYPITQVAAEPALFAIGTIDPSTTVIRITSSKLQFWLNGSTGGMITCSTTIGTNTWYHVALVRSGSATNNVKLYLNGVVDGQGTSTFVRPAAPAVVARYGSTQDSGAFAGYIDDLRLTNGYARYTTNFTAPTEAFKLK